MRVVDTNVLLHAVNPASAQQKLVREILDRASELPGAILFTWGIVYEFLRVATHPNVFDQPLDGARAWRFVSVLLGRGAHLLVATAQHRATLTKSLGELPALTGNRMHDLHTAILMREHGIREILTFDTDFHAFPWVRVVAPSDA